MINKGVAPLFHTDKKVGAMAGDTAIGDSQLRENSAAILIRGERRKRHLLNKASVIPGPRSGTRNPWGSSREHKPDPMDPRFRGDDGYREAKKLK